MSTALTVGDIRPILDLVTALPQLDDSESLAAQLRPLLTGLGVVIDADLDAVLTVIETNPILVDIGIAEFRAAIEGLPDDTLLTDIGGLLGDGSTGGGDGGDDTDGGTTVPGEPGPDGSVSYTLPFSQATITVDGGSVSVTIDGETTVLQNIDRLNFTDGSLYIDPTATAGTLKVAYEALFDRAPDAGGFDFWLSGVKSGAADFFALTSAFVATAEFNDSYGAFLDDAEALMEQVYLNLFNRAADAAGLDYWTAYLEQEGVGDSIDEVFAHFLQSEEMADLVGTTYPDGVFV